MHRIEQSTSIPTTQYEFPNGYNVNLTVEKFKLCEGLFNSSSQNLKGVSGGDLLSIPNVVINSASLCDVDIRTVGRYGCSTSNNIKALSVSRQVHNMKQCMVPLYYILSYKGWFTI